MALSSTDQKQIVDAVVKGLGSLLQEQARGGFGSPRSKGSRKISFDDIEESVDDLQDIIGSSSKSIGELGKVIERMRKSTKASDEDLREMSVRASILSNAMQHMRGTIYDFDGPLYGFIDHLEKSSKATAHLKTQTAKAAANSAMFSAALMDSSEYLQEGSHRYRAVMQDAANSLRSMSKSFLKNHDLVDAFSGDIKDINKRDLANVRLSLGSFNSVLTDVKKSFNIQSLQDLIQSKDGNTTLTFDQRSDSNSGLTSGLISAMAVAHKQGLADFNTDSFEFLDKSGQITQAALDALRANDQLMAKFTKTLLDAESSSEKLANSLDKTAFRTQTALGGFVSSVKELAHPMEFLKNKLSDLASAAAIAANIEKAKSGISNLYREIVNFNAAMVPETYMAVNLAAVKLGLSFEDTVKFMQDNGRLMAIMGNDFSGYTSNLKGTFEKFGLNMEQAAGLTGSLNESMLMSGVNMRDSDSMNQYISDSLASWQSIAAVSGETSQQYLQAKADILSSDVVKDDLLGMSAERAQAYAKDTEATWNHYKALGMSAEAAKELLLAQRRQAREGIVQRMAGAARAQLLAKMVGMDSGDAQRLSALALKGRARTEKENREFASLSGEMARREQEWIREAADRGDTGTMIVREAMTSAIREGGGEIFNAGDQAADLERAKKAKADLTEEERAQVAALAKGNESVAELSNVINSLASIINNSMIGAIASSVLALVGLTWQAYRAAAALGMIRGGGLLDFLPGRRGGNRRFNSRGGVRKPGSAARLDRMNASRNARNLPPMPGGPGAGRSLGSQITGGAKPVAGGLLRQGAKSVPYVGTALSLGFLASDISSINAAREAGEITEAEATKEKGAAVGATAGGLAGMAAGAKLGGVIGTFFGPGIGTAAGALIGGAAGGIIGSIAGSGLGEDIAGAWNGDDRARKNLTAAPFTYNPLLQGGHWLGQKMGLWDDKTSLEDKITSLLPDIDTPEGGMTWENIKKSGGEAISAMAMPVTSVLKAGSSIAGWFGLGGGASGVGGAGSTGIAGAPASMSVPGITAAASAAALGAQPVLAAEKPKVNSIAAQAGITDISDVQDLGTHHHLQIAVTKLDEAIRLLTIISGVDSKQTEKEPKRAGMMGGPSSRAYLTGSSN